MHHTCTGSGGPKLGSFRTGYWKPFLNAHWGFIPIPIANAINMSYPFGMGGTHGKAKRRIHGRAGEAGAGRP